MRRTDVDGRPAADINLELLRTVARRIGPLRERVMFLGGVIVPLLVPGELSSQIRLAKDADIMVHAGSKADLWAFEDQLWELGLKRRSTGATSHWRLDDIHLDVLTTEPDTVDFINRWGREAVQEKRPHDLGGGLVINAIRSTQYLAVKIDAFYRRGYQNHQTSTDIYDILLVLRGCPDFESDFRQHTSAELQSHLATELTAIAAAATAWHQQVTVPPRFDAFGRQWKPEIFDRLRRLCTKTPPTGFAATV